MSEKPPPDDFGETRPSQLPDMGRTQPSTPTPRELPPAPPPPPQPHVRPYSAPPPPSERRRKRKQSSRGGGDSGLFLPLWSVIIMLIAVAGIAFGLVFLVANIGAQNAPGGQPRIIIITAVPSVTPAGFESVLTTPTIPAGFDQGIQTLNPSFALSGPTLPPVIFSPTPDVISVGRTVIVAGVSPDQLNVRDSPGIQTNVLFRVAEGYLFAVVDGPTQADGLTWWKVQDNASGQSGWVASNYLQVVPQQ